MTCGSAFSPSTTFSGLRPAGSSLRLAPPSTPRLSLLAICATAAAAATTPAHSTELDLTVGAKIWANEWTSWAPTPAGGSNGVRVIESVSADTQTAVIPQASLRYGDWIAAASYFTNTNYSLGGLVNPSLGTLEQLPAKRKEVDGNVGYYLLPSMALTLGYKEIDQNFESTHYKWTGPTVGITASAPIKGSFGFFGTLAYGRLTLKASVPDDAGRSSFHADYVLSEAGLSYGFATPLSGLAITLTASYRAQFVGTREYQVATGLGGYAAVDLHDMTYGPVVSVLARF